MKLTFIGDVMLGRMIGAKYDRSPFNLIDKSVIASITSSDFVIANLESPIAVTATTEGDHLQFSGNPKLIKQFDWVTAFSLANNHITDCGLLGIDETIDILDSNGIHHNGVFSETYAPLRFEKNGQKVSVITFTDMLNIPFPEDSKWNVLRMGDDRILQLIKEEKSSSYKVILFAHVGILFTRFPNPVTREYLLNCVDAGADVVVTCHSHCLGGMEMYKNVPIFHSIGDFCMDGNSERRRTAAMLTLDIDGYNIDWEITPTHITDTLTIELLEAQKREKVISDFMAVSEKIKSNSDNYESFFKTQYRKEIIAHSFSTLRFLLHERGVSGLCKMLMQRSAEVGRTLKWATSDRSKDQRDDDAIKADRKKISQEDLFGK